MASFWDNLAIRFKQGNVAVKLIYINSLVFVLQWAWMFVCRLLHMNASAVLLLQLPADMGALLQRPWSIVTYMFMHSGLTHLLLNMIWLYFFGTFFLQCFNKRQFVGLYLVGGIVGALCFVAAYNWLPGYQDALDHSLLLGASAAIMALTIAVACYRPDQKTNLLFLGRISMNWIAAIVIFLDVLSLNGDNAGSSFAHLGGAVSGLAFGLYMRYASHRQFSGESPVHEWLEKLFKKKKKQAKYRRSQNESTFADPDQQWRDQKKADEHRLDSILDKIKQSGYSSLTEEEKKFLFEAGK